MHMAMTVLPLVLNCILYIHCKPRRWSTLASTVPMCGVRSSPHGNRHRANIPIDL